MMKPGLISRIDGLAHTAPGGQPERKKSETYKKAIGARNAEREICLNCRRPTCDGCGSDREFRKKNQRLPDAGSGKEEK